MSASAAPGPPGLWQGERLLLAAVRAWASCRAGRGEPARTIRRAIACVASEQTGALFAAFMEALEGVSRRPMRLHCGACPGYAEDEQRLILACGLSAVAPDLAARLLEPLARDPSAAVCFARALNVALVADGLALPARLTDGAEPVTWH
ncbi:hypothetical protein [Phenylobacterium sp.]|uniref:hypothetical protein n=1 Tax=Phenylobacterium sp. TaxID=1871053 RepID=UPI0035B23BC8